MREVCSRDSTPTNSSLSRASSTARLNCWDVVTSCDSTCTLPLRMEVISAADSAIPRIYMRRKGHVGRFFESKTIVSGVHRMFGKLWQSTPRVALCGPGASSLFRSASVCP